MAVVVLQHVEIEGPGRIAAAVRRGGRSMSVVRGYEGEAVPVAPDGIDGLVVMGGPMGAGDADAHPHLLAEQRLITACLAAGTPVLGICLGSQLLAAALGARVAPGTQIELGWLPVTLSPAAAADPVFAGLPPAFDPLHWHGDLFDLPDGAVSLAASAQTPVQAFRYGRTAYGMLFHLEAEQQQVAAMAAQFPQDLAEAGVALSELSDARRPAAIRRIADTVFDRWVALLA